MAPAEFERVVAAHRRAEEREWYRAAWIVAHLLAPHVKKGRRPPTPEKLLGLPPRTKDRNSRKD